MGGKLALKGIKSINFNSFFSLLLILFYNLTTTKKLKIPIQSIMLNYCFNYFKFRNCKLIKLIICKLIYKISLAFLFILYLLKVRLCANANA